MKNIKQYLEEKDIKSPYLKYAKNIYTQFGDDGIIERLLYELQIKSGVVVEFGAWDGIYLSNVYNLWKYKKFDAILIESDPIRANEMLSLSNSFDNVECMNCPVSPNKNDEYSLDNLFKKSNLNINNDNLVMVVIDVDSCDYHIFESIEEYKPILFVIETAGGWPWDAEYVGTGASLKSLTDLAISKGYTLVCCNGNAYFVRNDKVSSLIEFDSSLTIKDYHMCDEIVVNIFSRLDTNGNILEYDYWQHPDYLNFINKEKMNSKKKLITFSLFGDKPIYCKGAVENAKLAKRIYSDWIARFYVADDVPEEYINELKENDAEVVICERKSSYDGLNWRFRPLFDDTVDVWISRDCDSRLSWREKSAVDEWLTTDKSVHLMRDCYNHSYTIMAGMFGVNNRLFHERYGKINLEVNYSDNREDDQTVLHNVIWPKIIYDHLCHDYWNHTKPIGNPTYQEGDTCHYDNAYGGCGLMNYVTGVVKQHHPYLYLPEQDNRPFPEHDPMEYGIFVGQIIDEDNKPVINMASRWEYELRALPYG